MSPPLTPEQEARIREIVREVADEDDVARRIWDGMPADAARESVSRNRRMVDNLRAGMTIPEAVAAERARD